MYAKNYKRHWSFFGLATIVRIMLMYYINLEKLLNNPSYDLEIMLSDATRALVNAVLRLLSRDGQGNIKASRVPQLRKMAEDSGDERILDEIRHVDMWNL